jgi:hypothetical protein
MTDKTFTGGCMCRAVRYEASGEPLSVIHCHCLSCRRHNGAAVVTLAEFNKDNVRFTGDERKIYTSSPGVGRAFCGKCGTPLTWEGDDGPILEFHISTFDEPDGLVPQSHSFYVERIAWFDTADTLPRYRGFSGDSELLGNDPAPGGPSG